MSENHIQGKEPLWLLIEKELKNYQVSDCSDTTKFATAEKVAASLDSSGYNVSKSAGNWMQLVAAITASGSVGRPFIGDFDKAVGALTLDNIKSINSSAWDIINSLGGDWPFLLDSVNRDDVKDIVRDKRVALVIDRAKELGGEKGIRFLLTEGFDQKKIVEIMGISDDEFGAVKAKVDAELAEIQRIKDLLASVADKDDQERIKHLLNENAADELIVEVGGFDQSAVDTAKSAMEAELAEKKRLEEEEAARKAKEAAGPSLDEIDDDEMLEYIENIREILDFAGNEKEIRVMCEQSSIPKALVEIAVSEPDKLDELEAKAEG